MARRAAVLKLRLAALDGPAILRVSGVANADSNANANSEADDARPPD